MSILIKDIQRNSSEIIRIEVSEFKGKELINIRIWYVAGRDMDGNDIYKPTQKGVALNISEFNELRDGVNKLEAYIKDKSGGTVPEQPARSIRLIIPKVFLTMSRLKRQKLKLDIHLNNSIFIMSRITLTHSFLARLTCISSW
jgi:hypothetical protein